MNINTRKISLKSYIRKKKTKKKKTKKTIHTHTKISNFHSKSIDWFLDEGNTGI